MSLIEISQQRITILKELISQLDKLELTKKEKCLVILPLVNMFVTF